MRAWIVGALIAAVLAAVVVVRSTASHEQPPTLPHQTATQDYLPGIAADLFVPDHARRAPLVVLIPGGGWTSADRSGLRPLADLLAAHGIVAVTATYRPASDGQRFPVQAADVECAIDFAVSRTQRAKITPTSVVVLGHSAGAQLAVLAALTGQRFRAGCPYPPVRVDGAIGLAGVYDLVTFRDIAEPLIGRSPAADPTAWRQASPLTWTGARPDLPLLLAHGVEDTTVPLVQSTWFAQRLRASGHRVDVELVPGADHGSLYQPDVIGSRVIAWVDRLAAAAHGTP